MWDFGDGSPTVTTMSSTVSHTYSSASSYPVSLTVTDDYGGSASATQNVTVYQPPDAVISPVSQATEGSPATFDGTSSNDPNGGGITAYAWSFGDGGTATTSQPSHTYGAPGTYTVSLTVTDAEGDTATTSTPITVAEDAGSASIAANPTSTTAGTAITFTGSSSDTDDTSLSYAWRFGDGATATGASAHHAYATAGTYTVVLTITDSDGTETTSQRVSVAPLITPFGSPMAVFAGASPRAGAPVHFDGSRSLDPNAGGRLTYRWTFGDGGVGVGPRPTHTFRAGAWKVTLTVTDDASNRSASLTRVLHVAAPACVVPALKGLSLTRARRALSAAHCSTGQLSKPHEPSSSPGKGRTWTLVVAGQSRRAGSVHPRGTAVRLTLVWRAR